MGNERSGDRCIGELVIWKNKFPKIIICDVSELRSLDARRAEGLLSGPMRRAEFPGIKASDMYTPLMAAVEKGRYKHGTYDSSGVECSCEFSNKYLTERGIVRIGNILFRLGGIIPTDN